MDIITLIVIGIYTIVNIIIFIIQKSQIDKQREVISSMKSFMDIFKIDEVKKYIELKENRMMMQFEDEIMKSGKLDKLTDVNMEILQEIYGKQMGTQHFEMTKVIIKGLVSLKKEEREAFIIKELNSCKHIFIPMLVDLENNNR